MKAGELRVDEEQGMAGLVPHSLVVHRQMSCALV